MIETESTAPIHLPIVNLANLETVAIKQALLMCDGNRTLAAKALGIDRRTLQRKIIELVIDIPVANGHTSQRPDRPL